MVSYVERGVHVYSICLCDDYVLIEIHDSLRIMISVQSNTWLENRKRVLVSRCPKFGLRKNRRWFLMNVPEVLPSCVSPTQTSERFKSPSFVGGLETLRRKLGGLNVGDINLRVYRRFVTRSLKSRMLNLRVFSEFWWKLGSFEPPTFFGDVLTRRFKPPTQLGDSAKTLQGHSSVDSTSH